MLEDFAVVQPADWFRS